MSSPFKLRNLLLLLAVGLAAALAVVAVSRYRPPLAIPVAAPALPEGIDLALQKIDYTHTEGGVARWRLAASRAEHQSDSKLVMVKDLELTFFDAKGAEQVTLKAREGRLGSDYAAVEVGGGVDLHHRDGYRLSTEWLRYSQADGMIRTDAPIRMTGKDVTLDGVGLRIDLNRRRLHVPAKVRAVLAPQSN